MHTILVIENDHSSRVALRAVLENEGWVVYSAGNGVEGLHTLSKIKPPCFVLLDQKMPLLDGEGFLKAKNEHPEWSKIQVIVMSGYDDQTSHLKAVGFLTKPINADKVIEMINKYCTIDHNDSMPETRQA